MNFISPRIFSLGENISHPAGGRTRTLNRVRCPSSNIPVRDEREEVGSASFTR